MDSIIPQFSPSLVKELSLVKIFLQNYRRFWRETNRDIEARNAENFDHDVGMLVMPEMTIPLSVIVVHLIQCIEKHMNPNMLAAYLGIRLNEVPIILLEEEMYVPSSNKNFAVALMKSAWGGNIFHVPQSPELVSKIENILFSHVTWLKEVCWQMSQKVPLQKQG